MSRVLLNHRVNSGKNDPNRMRLKKGTRRMRRKNCRIWKEKIAQVKWEVKMAQDEQEEKMAQVE